MKRKIFALTVVVIMLLGMMPSAIAQAEYAAEFSILGTAVDFENEVFSDGTTVFVPLEELCSYLKLSVTKENDYYTVVRREKTAVVRAENMICTLNGKETELSAHPCVKDGVLYVPADFFEKCLGMPITASEDGKSIDLAPNVYTIDIDANHAAAVSGEKPNDDTLSAAGNDILFEPGIKYPIERQKSVYYLIDFKTVKGLKINEVNLSLHVAKGGNNNPYINVIRTALWEKGNINFNNKPVEFVNEKSKSITLGANYEKNQKNFIHNSFDITALSEAALKEGDILSVKVQGNPYSGMSAVPSAIQASLRGVGTQYAPKVYVTTEESFTFPVKKNDLKMSDASDYDDVKLLASLGIVTTEDEFPVNLTEAKISRGEFIKYALRLRGENQIQGSKEQHFADVAEDNEYFADIAAAYAAGYVTGDAGTSFRPYDAITLNEACAVIGRMLGYDEYAVRNGGYAQGYVQAATKNSILSGVRSEKGALTYQGAIKMLVNSLDVPMFVATLFTPGVNAEYVFDEDTTILTEFFDATTMTGTVTANEYSALEGSIASPDRIVIDGKSLILKYEGYNEFLGYKVKAYYNSENELLYVGSKEANPQIVALDLVENVTQTSSSITVNYKENGKSKSLTFSKNSVIYNGKVVPSNSVRANMFEADGGQIVKLSNGTVIARAYATMIAYSINIDDEVISDKYDAFDKALRLKDTDNYTFTDTDGNEMKLENVKQGSVLSVAKSLDGKIVNVIVSEKKVTGTIQTITDGGTEDEILEISGLSYKTVNRYNDWTKEIMPGKSGIFYIDAFGQICDFEKGDMEDVIGYMIDMDYGNASSLSKKLQAAIVVKSREEYGLYDLADKVKINGDKKENHAEIYEMFLDDNDEFIQQAVLFSTNSEGKISEINTAVDAAGTLDESTLASITDKTLVKRHSSPANTKNIYYKGTSGRLSDQFYWKIAEQLSIVVPEDPTVLEDFEVITGGVSNGNIEAEVYTLGINSPVARMVLLKNYLTSASPDSALYVVQKTSKKLDDEGYYNTTFSYFTDPNTVAELVVPDEDETLLEGIERGDIVRIAKNYKGELTALSKYYDYSDKTITNNAGFASGSINSSARVYGGYVISKEDNYVKIAQDAENVDSKPLTDFRWIDVKSAGTLYKYEVDGKNVVIKRATADDIRDYDTVPYDPSGLLLYTRYTVMGNSYIIELDQPAGTGIYKAEFAGGEGTTGTAPSFIRVNIGDTITIPDGGTLMKNEYRFMGWNIEGTVYQPGDTYTITSDTTVFNAEWEWEGQQYLITFSGGDGAEGESFTKTTSDAYPLLQMPTTDDGGVPRFTKPGHVYRVWTDGVNDYNPGESYSITSQITITPKWIECWDGAVSETAPQTTVIDGKTFYQITNGNELAWFSNEVDKSGGDGNVNAILTKDIRLNLDGEYVNNWAGFQIGNVNAFAGIFDGNGKKIINYYYESGATYSGMFHTINGGSVKNLTFENAKFVSTATATSSTYSAIVCGYAIDATFDSITVSGSAYAAEGKYMNCYGSILGYANNSAGANIIVENCVNNASIDASAAAAYTNTGNNTGLGGVVGCAYRGTKISGCTNNGAIYAPKTYKVGGVVGNVRTNTYNSITNCNNTAQITGYNSYIGQIYGYKQGDVPATGNTENGSVVVTNQ